VPEIADGLVEIANVAREPGYRSKIAVVSHTDGVDPVGACVGPRGSRVRMVVSELRGEKIDIIPFNDEPARFVAKALSPARVREVLVDDDAKQATVIVPDDQLSLAIGREGQNARLAARLTGWRVDIRSETEFAAEEAEHGYEEEEVAGRCAAILSNGRRCPNAALPGSRYCGLETHQALAQIEGDNIEDLGAEGSEAEAVTETASAVAVAEAPQEAAEDHIEVVDVSEVSAPLGETEAAVIAPDPEETGAEAEAELAEKLEEEEAGSGPEEVLAEASEDAAEESAT
jgi:N utilization substance protein A